MACIYLFFSSFLFFFFFFSKDIFSQFRQEIVWRGCVGVCVCVHEWCVFVPCRRWRLLQEPREQIGETDVFSTLSQKLFVWVWNGDWKTKRREKKEEQISCRTAEFAFGSLRFLFLYLYIWILSVAVEISTRGIPEYLLYKDIKSVTQRWRVARRGAAVERPAPSPSPAPSPDASRATRTLLCPIRRVQEQKKKTKKHFQHLCSSSESRRNSALGGHSSASMLAPKPRIDGDEIYSVRRRWPLKSASLRCPRLFSAVRVICVCTGWFLPIKCMWMYKCFLSVIIFVFLRLSIWVLQTERGGGSVELQPRRHFAVARRVNNYVFFVRPAPPPAHPKPIFTP